MLLLHCIIPSLSIIFISSSFHFNSTALLKDIPKLKSILLYHVVSGVVKPNRNGRSFETINGKEISVSEKGDVSDGEDDDDDRDMDDVTTI